MEVQKSKSKLTRTSSSLVRSPTIRSPIQSASSVDEEPQKKTHKPLNGNSLSSLFFPLFLIVFLPLFLFFYLKGDIPTSLNFLIGLSIVGFAVKRVFSIKNSFLSLPIFRNYWEERNRLQKGDSVQWFIGDGSGDPVRKQKQRIFGEGVEFFSNGDCYEGEFHNGKSNGSGVYNYFVNGRYEGDWVDGRYDGYGIESWAKGSRYRGQYRQGMRHGFGVYRFYTGDSYSGQWFNGQSHGVGVQKCSDGSCYIGEFKCGIKHGLGCYYFRNGDRYAGEYFGDKIHGFGIYHFSNGHCYEGSWHEGRKQGLGVYTFRNGEMRCGEWDCGVLKNPHPQLTGAFQHAVQSARKAAENSIRLPRMDEQVNRAVIAANRAASAARVASIKAVQSRKFCDTEV